MIKRSELPASTTAMPVAQPQRVVADSFGTSRPSDVVPKVAPNLAALKSAQMKVADATAVDDILAMMRAGADLDSNSGGSVAGTHLITGEDAPRNESPTGRLPHCSPELSIQRVAQGGQGTVYRVSPSPPSSPDFNSLASASLSERSSASSDSALKVGELKSIAREFAVYDRLRSHGDHPCIPRMLSEHVLTSSDPDLGQFSIEWVTGREMYNLCEAVRTPKPPSDSATSEERLKYQEKITDLEEKRVAAEQRIDMLVDKMYEKAPGSLTEHARLPEPKPTDLMAKRELIAQLACLQMAGAIAHMQRSQIVFRDFQPKNFLLDDATLEVHLIDLGLADAPGGRRGMDMVGVGGYGSPPVSRERTLQFLDDTWGFVSLIWGLAQGEAPFGLKTAPSDDRNVVFTKRSGDYCSGQSDHLYLTEGLSPLFCDFVKRTLPRESMTVEGHISGIHDHPTLDTVREHPWFQQAMERFPDVVAFARV